MDMIGHVTSSYYSAALGHSIALALVKNGRNRKGDTIYVPIDGTTTACEVVDPIFYDLEGERLNG
jgi:sarcosine oxidase subunit alpha